jgi:hypothetical protein
MDAERPPIYREMKMAEKKDKEKVKKELEAAGFDLPEGAWWDEEAGIWRDKNGDPVGPGSVN